MNVAVIGAGKMGSFHVRTLRENSAVQEVRVFDSNLPAASTHPTLDAALDGAAAAIIATPASTHAALIHRCLKAGIPTFCEKPVALELEETRKVVGQVERLHGVLQVGFQRRFDQAYRRVRERVRDGSLGRIYSFYMASRDRTPPPDGYIPTSGGMFKDSHIHDFDAVRWLFGQEVEEVYATGGVLGFPAFAQHGDIDTSAVVLVLRDGTAGVLTGGRHNPAGYDVRVDVFGSRDTVRIEPGTGHPDFLSRFADAYRAEGDHFLRLAVGEAENPCTAVDGLEALRIAEACDRSRKDHRPVSMGQIN